LWWLAAQAKQGSGLDDLLDTGGTLPFCGDQKPRKSSSGWIKDLISSKCNHPFSDL